MGVENVNGILDIQNTDVRISQLTGQLGGGEITAGGVVTYKPQVQLNIGLDAKGVRLRYPEGLRAVLSSNLVLSGTTEDFTLDWRVVIDSLGFHQDFDIFAFAG